MFKKGQRVEHSVYGAGRVVEVFTDLTYPDGLPYFVEFDKRDFRLHSGGFKGMFGKPNRCYWCADAELKKVCIFKGNK